MVAVLAMIECACDLEPDEEDEIDLIILELADEGVRFSIIAEELGLKELEVRRRWAEVWTEILRDGAEAVH